FQPDGPVFFRVFDTNGKMIDAAKWLGGHTQITVDGSNWPSGVYWIRMEDGKRAGVVRVVKTTPE
ncbi:MAG TPA: T9SS type A sorting domain-containing protein, partial [Flavilitoribacter sp.]|nr:T9SS type A sorting domain-containing protein [Flavilitoribacter sp.]